jgi:carboxyl-terminal processing protease
VTTLSLLAALTLRGPALTEEFTKPWQDVSQAIRSRYYGRKSKEDLMKRLLDKYEPLAIKATSRKEFGDTVTKMIREFGDSHFDFFTPSDQGYYLMDELAGGSSKMVQIGAWFRPSADGYTVQMVLEGTSAEKAGLMKGDLVLKADGASFAPIDSLLDKEDKEVTLTIRRAGKEMEKKVEVKKSSALDMFLDATRDSARVIESGGKKIGYVHLWTMANQRFRDSLSSIVYGKLKDTDAMILDIRDGFGGRPEGFGDPFFRPDATLGWKMGDNTVNQLFGYGRPVVLLINGGSRSAKEVFSYLVKKTGRMTLMGSTTAGHVLGTSPARVNEWSMLEIPMVEVFADGKVLEGKGVDPDIKLPTEFDSSGKDLYIDSATTFLLKKLKG